MLQGRIDIGAPQPLSPPPGRGGAVLQAEPACCFLPLAANKGGNDSSPTLFYPVALLPDHAAFGRYPPGREG